MSDLFRWQNLISTCVIYAKFEQTITRQHVLLRQKSFTDGTMVTIIIVFARFSFNMGW
jgi:hypothetical protein